MKYLYAILLLALSWHPGTGWGQTGSLTFRADWVPNPELQPTGDEPYLFGYPAGGFGSSDFQRGSGVTVGDTLSNAYIGSGWADPSLGAAEQNARFYYVLVGGEGGTYLIDIQNIAFYLYRSATGPAWYQWEYSLDGFATPGIRLGDSVNFTQADQSVFQQYDLRQIPDLQQMYGATFRLYAWGAADTGGIFGIGPNPGANSLSFTGKYSTLRPELGFGCAYCTQTLQPFVTAGGTPSAMQICDPAGEGVIDSIEVVVTPGYELSLDNSNFYTYLSIPNTYVNYWVGAPVSVRLKADAAPGTYNGYVQVQSLHISPFQLPISGTVNPAPPSILAVNSNSLEFGYAGAGAVVDKKITLKTGSLSANITARATGRYQVSADSVDFGATATIGRDTGENKAVALFIRFSPDADELQFNDSVRISAGADTTLTVRVKGNSLLPSSTVNVSTWNLNYFGTSQRWYGPADKSQQTDNIKTILPRLHSDVYALQGVVNDSLLAAVVSAMPGYAHVISNYGSLSNPSDPNHVDSASVSRLAFVYNTARVRNVQTTALLSNGVNTAGDVGSPGYVNWASGRFPFMLTADVDVSDSNGNTITKKIRFINVHASDNSNPVNGYNQRVSAAYALDTLIKNNYSGDNVIILGDFNDDLNHSVVSGLDTTSFRAFIADSAYYQFPTKVLSQQQQRSNANFPGVTSNMIVNDPMSLWYLPSSALVLPEVSGEVPAYTETTAGNYPVAALLSFTPPTPLPVTLLDFTAVRRGAVAKLSWSTTGEVNSGSFVIERSGDNGIFVAIGTVKATGGSKTTTRYGFTDEVPLRGENYYRLRQVDVDGRFTYSKTVLLDFSGMGLHISPNPAHGMVNLFVNNMNEAFNVRIVDVNGRTVLELQTAPGTANIPVDVSRLAKGIYTVKVTGATTVAVQQLLVE